MSDGVKEKTYPLKITLRAFEIIHLYVDFLRHHM